MTETKVQPYPQTPVLEMGPAVAVMVLNAIPGIAGVGTLVAAIVGHERLIGRAVAQFFLQIIIVGYVWSVITGIQALINASWGDKNKVAAAEPVAAAPAAKKAAPKKAAKKTVTKKSAK